MEFKFSEFRFGPPLLRMLCMMDKPDLAYDLFTDLVKLTLFSYSMDLLCNGAVEPLAYLDSLGN